MAVRKPGSLRNARQIEIRIAAAVFLLPALLFIVVYIVYRIVETFISSTMDWNGLGRHRVFTGLTNWINLIEDGSFWKAFSNNFKIMFLSILFQVPFALLLATFLEVADKNGNMYKIIWFFPYLLSSVAIGVLFKYSLDAGTGIFASISKMMGGGGVDLLGSPGAALYTVIGVICWQYIPFYMVLYMAAYGTIPVELYEAASIDGATQSQYFWLVSLPLLKPTIFSGMTLSIIGSLKYFDLIYVMTGGGPGVATELMATYMYKMSFISFDMGYGAAVAGGMFILITVVAMIVVNTLNRNSEV